jgi:nucleoside-diphosphate-sugar epimerase
MADSQQAARQMTRVLVTGATGFVGTALCELLAQAGCIVRAALRSDRPVPSCIAEKVVTGDIAARADLAAALDRVDAVIHAAARTHVLHDSPVNTELYMQINARGTQHLAEAAAQAGVRRFVYLSSIKVNGEESNRGYRPDDGPCPRNAYGMSKWLGERHLQEVAARTGIEAAIVRSPLVYGAGVGANFLRLMHWVDRGWPLPFRSIHNRRSLVSVWNLGDLLVRVLMRPAASGRVWFVSDGDDLSTVDLIQRLGTAMGRPVRLLPVPVGALRAAAAVTGKAAVIERLCGSLFVDITQTQRDLDWTPPLSVAAGLARTVGWYSRLR